MHDVRGPDLRRSGARLREVVVDAMAGDEVVITKGLEPGEQVAASGSFKLREAALVAVTNKPESVALNGGQSQAQPNATSM